MLKEEVEQILNRRPFVPLRLRRTDGRTLDIPFSHVARPLATSLIVFKGVKREGSYQAKGFEEMTYDKIERIEPRSARPGGRRKAS